MQKKSSNSLRLTSSHYKILFTVKFLNDVSRYPSAKGVRNVLSGNNDAETIKYASLKTYETLISCPSRRFSSLVNNLLRHDYLKYIYDKKSDSMYLRLSNKGLDTITRFNVNKTAIFRKKISHHKCEIVEIK